MSCICICMYHLDWCHVPDRCLSQDFCLAVTVVSRRHPSIDYLFLCRIEQWLFIITHVQIVFIFENNFLWTFYFIVGQSCLYTPPSSWYNPRYLRLLRCWYVFLVTTDALALASSSTAFVGFRFRKIDAVFFLIFVFDWPLLFRMLCHGPMEH